MVLLDKLLKEIRQLYPDADLDLIRRAFNRAAEAHSDQSRLSGEPFLTHLVEVSSILVGLKMDLPTIATGLLHDTIEDTDVTFDQLKEEFGEEIARLVDGVTKIGRITFRTSEEKQAENFRKMLLAMARDLRVIIVKLADRLHNMRTLEHQPEATRKRIARETLDIFAPLANRLGISWVKSDLEDLAFRYIEPEFYADLVNRAAGQKKERDSYIEDIRGIINKMLAENDITAEVSGRSKHLYSIYLKMVRQGLDFDQIYDLTAFRVIVDSVRDCYAVLGIIHAAWKPIPGRFKDYIAMPKANMYQSLHTTVIGPYGGRIEVQIRTEEMHRIAEEGIAAHWKYKEEGKSVATTREDSGFRWLRQMLEWQQEVKDSKEFIDTVKIELFPEEVYVFTPGGDVKELPRGSTPVDFAYIIHTDVGNRCVGARVNGRMVPLRTTLNNGDIVEVLTSKQHSPSKDWLAFVKTSKARNKIRQWVKAEQREKSIDLGKNLLEKELRKHGYSMNRALSGDVQKKLLADLGFGKIDDLLANVGYGKVTVGQVVNRVVPKEKISEDVEAGRFEKVLDKLRRKPKSAIKIQGVDDILVRFAKCCNPVPGDPITGFITRGRGVTVHTADCPHVIDSDPDRWISVEWDISKQASRAVTIRIVCADRKGMLAAISSAITDNEANILSAHVQSNPDQGAINDFEIDIRDVDHLNKVISSIKKLNGVHKVVRIKHS
ncbi:MAG: GTP pyrophosphokinase [Desulfuromonas sp.]|nr:MAG: GTP pyrophosphokinase [Desulfuromonas sp.]